MIRELGRKLAQGEAGTLLVLLMVAGVAMMYRSGPPRGQLYAALQRR